MGLKSPTVKSLVRRVQHIKQTVSEPTVVLALRTTSLAPARAEAITVSDPVGRVNSRVERVEKGVEMRDTSLLANHRASIFDLHTTAVVEFAYTHPPALLPEVCPHTTPGTPPPPIVYP